MIDQTRYRKNKKKQYRQIGYVIDFVTPVCLR